MHITYGDRLLIISIYHDLLTLIIIYNYCVLLFVFDCRLEPRFYYIFSFFLLPFFSVRKIFSFLLVFLDGLEASPRKVHTFFVDTAENGTFKVHSAGRSLVDFTRLSILV